jgi:hypothetical protein
VSHSCGYGFPVAVLDAAKTTMAQFNVGDKVECFYNDSGYEFVGLVGKIIRVDDDEFEKYPYQTSFSRGQWFGDHELRLIEDKPEPSKWGSVFMVGDKVALKDYSTFDDYRQHDKEVAVIRELESEGLLPIQIEWKDGDVSSVNLSNLMKVTEEEKIVVGTCDAGVSCVSLPDMFFYDDVRENTMKAIENMLSELVPLPRIYENRIEKDLKNING